VDKKSNPPAVAMRFSGKILYRSTNAEKVSRHEKSVVYNNPLIYTIFVMEKVFILPSLLTLRLRRPALQLQPLPLTGVNTLSFLQFEFWSYTAPMQAWRNW
jgi:hypothetical protein